MRALINIDVNDIQKATDFYTRAFGLELGRVFGNDGVELLGFEAPVYLLLTAEGSTAVRGTRLKRDFERHWTPVHIDVAVDDIVAALTQATEAGATVEGEIEQRSWGKIVLLFDPFGHGWCILEFNKQGYDAIATLN